MTCWLTWLNTWPSTMAVWTFFRSGQIWFATVNHTWLTSNDGRLGISGMLAGVIAPLEWWLTVRVSYDWFDFTNPIDKCIHLLEGNSINVPPLTLCVAHCFIVHMVKDGINGRMFLKSYSVCYVIRLTTFIISPTRTFGANMNTGGLPLLVNPSKFII